MPCVEQILGGLLDLDVAGERGDDRLVDALRLHLVDDLDHELREHHRRRDDRVPVAEDQRVDARILEAEADRVLVGLRRLAAGDVDRIAGGAERRDELAERRVEIGRHRHQREPVVDARVRQQHARAARAGDDDDVLALRRGQHGNRRARTRADRAAPRARITPDCLQHVLVDLVVAGERAGVRARRARAHARAAGLQHDDRLLLRHALRDLGERAAVLQVLAVLRDDVRVLVLLEEREQIVLVDVGLVAEADDRRHAHLGRAREADDRHADAARLRRQRRVALDVVRRAERRAEVLPRVVEAVDVGAHQAHVVLAPDRLDLLLARDVAGLGEAGRDQHGAGNLLLAALRRAPRRRTWRGSRTPRRRSCRGRP